MLSRRTRRAAYVPARLRSAGAEFRARPDTADRDELLAVVLLARSAETGQLAYGGNPEVAALWINTLVLSATIEEFRRRGWIEVDRPLSIQPTVEVSIRLTPEGMKHGDEIMRRRH